MSDETQDHPSGNEPNTLIDEDEASRLGFVMIPKVILYAKIISRDAKLLYGILKGYAWQESRCFPGYSRLCDDMDLSENMVRRYMRELIAVGLLVQQRRGQGKTNLYRLPPIRSAKIAVLEPQPIEVLKPQPTKVLEPQPTAVKIESRKLESVEIQPEDEDSNPTSLDNFDRPIEAYLRSVAAELHDEAPLKSSLTRALRLWSDTELSADEFIAAMAKAKQKTQKYSSSIRKKAEKAGGLLPTKNKMPYFFSVLRDALGLDGQSGD